MSIGREAVVAGRHRRVRGEDDLLRRRGGSPRRRRCLRASIRCRTSSSAANALWPSFRCSDAGRDAQRRQRPHAADAEQQLLADADAVVAAVETRGQLAILGLVAFDVESSSSSVLRPTASCPDAGGDRAGPRLDRDRDRRAVVRTAG